MATKAMTLEDLETAATPKAAFHATKEQAEKGEKKAPLQVRIPKSELKAFKRAAVEAEKTLSDFMLECFHAHMQKVGN
jgi:hypothetical protein